MAAKGRDRGRALRARLREPGVLVGAGCYSALTARITEAEGFDWIFLGASSLVLMQLAISDASVVSSAEVADLAAPIAGAVSIPVVLDCDSGGVTPADVAHSIRLAEKAGAAGVHLTDTLDPWQKKQSGASLYAIDEMVEKIRAAVAARSSSELVIIVRSEEHLSGDSPDAIIGRGRAYAEAGADVFLPFRCDSAGVDVVAKNVQIPLLLLNVPVRECGENVKMVGFGGPQILEPAYLHQQMMRHLHKAGEWGGPTDWIDEAATIRDGPYRPGSAKPSWLSHLSQADVKKFCEDAT